MFRSVFVFTGCIACLDRYWKDDIFQVRKTVSVFFFDQQTELTISEVTLSIEITILALQAKFRTYQPEELSSVLLHKDFHSLFMLFLCQFSLQGIIFNLCLGYFRSVFFSLP